MAKRFEREVQRLAILAALQEPGGRARTNEDIAQQCGSSIQLVRNVRKANPTQEERSNESEKLMSISGSWMKQGYFQGCTSGIWQGNTKQSRSEQV